jgi:hypothetical protein
VPEAPAAGSRSKKWKKETAVETEAAPRKKSVWKKRKQVSQSSENTCRGKEGREAVEGFEKNLFYQESKAKPLA